MKNIVQPRKSLTPIIIVLLLVFLGGSYFVLQMATVSSTTKDKDFIKILSSTTEKIQKSPLKTKWNNSIKKDFLEYEKWWAVGFGMLILIFWASQGVNKGEFEGIEHGSASWATDNDLASFRKPSSTIIGHNLYLQKNDKKKGYTQNRFIIGASGTGKTFGDVKPNILLAQDNYIVTDIKGEILRDTGYRLKQEGYTIKVLNLISMSDSMRFNPFYYLKEDEDVIALAETFIRNTDNGKQNGDGFWEKAERALLQAIMFYIYRELPLEEQNFANCLKLLITSVDLVNFDESKAKESMQVLDNMFQDIARKDPCHPGVENYKIFKLASGDTTTGILIGLAVRFSLFTVQKIKDLTSTDEMELDKLATDKVAIFCIIPEANRAFDLITAMFYSKLFEHMIWMADFKYNGRLPRHIKIILDEFANCGYIPNCDGYLTTIRSRNGSITPIIQELSQIQKLYEKNWKAIIANCDTFTFMGTNEPETLKYISQKLDKTTVQVNSKSYNYGSRGGRTESISYIERDLLKPNEVFELVTAEKQILFIKATKPIFADKFKTEKSKLYEYMPDRDDETDPRRTDYKKIRQLEKNSVKLNDVKVSKQIDTSLVIKELEKLLAEIS